MLGKINSWIERWMALVTPVCLLLGVLFPEIAGRGVPYVPYVFAFMTFAGAIKSTFKDVGNVFRNPLDLLLIFLVLHVVLPCMAWGSGMLFFGKNADLVTGIVLEFAVPSAVVSLMWVSIYRGQSSLSLALVVLDTVLAPFVIPLTLRMLVGAQVKMDVMNMMKELVFMIALPAVAAMCLNQITQNRVKEQWPSKLAFWSKLCLIFCVTSNSSKVAPYIRHLNGQRIGVAVLILVLAASGYAIGWILAFVMKKDAETTVSMIYGSGMRNISAGAVIAGAYFPGEVMFPVMIGTLFQQVLAACYGKLIDTARSKEKNSRQNSGK